MVYGAFMNRLCFLQVLWICFSSAELRGCPGNLWFQTSESHLSTLLTLEANYNHLPPDIARDDVLDGAECARMCFERKTCKSAVYSPNESMDLGSAENSKRAERVPDSSDPNHQSVESENGKDHQLDKKQRPRKGGVCILLPSDPGCNRNHRLISEIEANRGPVFMNCFSCAQSPTNETTIETDIVESIKDVKIAATGRRKGVVNKNITMSDDGERTWNDIQQSRKMKRQAARRRGFTIRVMTFNTFLSGGMVEHGLEKIAKHIMANQPEIVFLQEMSDSLVGLLLRRLDDREWSACSRNAGHLNHIITRLDIAMEFDPAPSMWNNGCQIRLWPPDNDFVINLWNVHLYPLNYGPYKACSKNNPMRSTNELFETESNRQDPSRGRLEQMEVLTRHEPFASLLRLATVGNGPPFIVAGDFNSASHLDWTEAARPLHCQLAFEWPVSKFMEQLGFRDSYRFLRSDPTQNGGTTWSTIYKDSTTEFVNGRPEPEPQDRIDFIYYKGQQLQVVDSYVYAGTELITLFPNFQLNDWPSDHASVVSRFIWTMP